MGELNKGQKLLQFAQDNPEFKQLLSTKEDIQEQPLPDAGEMNLSDLGNARRLIYRYGKHLRFCHAWGRWLVYDRSRWAVDETENITRFAKKTVRGIYEEASAAITDGLRKDLARHAIRSESEARIRAMIALAESEPGVPVVPVQLDNSPWLFNCLNGTIDLKTGELHSHKLFDYITKQAPVEYEPDAECPTWTEFLSQVMDGNEQLIRFLQKASGYSLSGDISEHTLFFLHGGGANGKSTFLNTLLFLMGDYATQAEPELLLSRGNNVHPTGLADLQGRRLAVCNEIEAGRRMAESLVKVLTGGDRIKARKMRQDFFEFAPSHKIWLAANHKPVVRGTDHAIWRRIRLVPFTVTIPEEQRDKHLFEKLKQELPGILTWAVKGCLLWQQEGLNPPDAVKAATESYRAEMDVTAAFIDECCIIKDFAKTAAGDLYKAYTEWCNENGERSESQKAFGMRLTERGFTRMRGTGGRYFWEGIGLVNDER